MPTPLTLWDQIDAERVKFELNLARGKHHEQTEKELEDILQVYLNTGDASLSKFNILTTLSHRLDQWPAHARRICENVQSEQRKKKTPEFVRAVLRRAVLPEIAAELRWSQEALNKLAQREKIPLAVFEHELTELKKWSRLISREWRQETEKEARELEDSRRIRSKRRVPLRRNRRSAKVIQPRGPTVTIPQKRTMTVAENIGELNILKSQLSEAIAKKQDRSFPPKRGDTSKTMSPGWTGTISEPGLRKRESDQRLVGQERKKQEDAHAAGSVFHHSADYRVVTFRDRKYQLTSAQAQVIQILHTAYLTPEQEIGVHYILEKIDARSSRLRDIFRSRPDAMKDLVKKTGRGIVRLNL